jgi:hypothetical protein
VGFHCLCLKTSGSAWTARVGGLLFGVSAMAGIGVYCRGNNVSFKYATPDLFCLNLCACLESCLALAPALSCLAPALICLGLCLSTCLDCLAFFPLIFPMTRIAKVPAMPWPLPFVTLATALHFLGTCVALPRPFELSCLRSAFP